MTRTEQLKTVRQALALECRIKEVKRRLSMLSVARYRPAPTPPEREHVQEGAPRFLRWKLRKRAALAELARRQEIADQRYAVEKRRYDEELLPAYQKAQHAWLADRDEQLRQAENELKAACAALAALYADSKLIPLPYRQEGALHMLYELMTAYRCDVWQAIDLYERHRSRYSGERSQPSAEKTGDHRRPILAFSEKI